MMSLNLFIDTFLGTVTDVIPIAAIHFRLSVGRSSQAGYQSNESHSWLFLRHTGFNAFLNGARTCLVPIGRDDGNAADGSRLFE